MSERSKRFRVALSFPGEQRTFMASVADRLATRLGRDRVLYDDFYTAEFARPDLDTYLQRLYHDESELIVVFVSEDYERKEWCGLEWRAIRDLIKKRQVESVMPCRFDMTEIPGLFSTDGYVWIGERSPREVADLILQRLEADNSVAPSPPQSSSGRSSQRIAPSRLPGSTSHLFGREAELTQLSEAWKDPATHLITFVAWGGVGKTALVAKWCAALAARDYDGADYFDWSFYSQGTREQGAASADPFIDAALRFFGDEAMADTAKSPWDKGSRLAKLVAERRTLLVLDGMEPLQYPPGSMTGRLKDQAMEALLKGLAARNAGLCVVTTRERLVDLATYEESTAPRRSLEHLSMAAGVELLRSLGVHGPDAELEELAKEVRGHALTLNLVGRFLHGAHGGDVRKRDLVNFAEADAEVQGGHTFRVMEAYERWFASEGGRGERLLVVLRLLGLFDRPASEECLGALRRPPAIPELTEPIVGLSDARWNMAVTRLAERGLVTQEAGNLDAHPLIREHFARCIGEGNPEGWKAAHGRIFDHLKETTKHRPDTLAGLQPLYQAVAHGCQAGREQEALVEVYVDRILHGTGSDGFYSIKKLGAFGADLGAVACFFERPWGHVSAVFTEAVQAWLLNQAAYHLRALGRLTEAVEPMRAGLERRVAQKNWKQAAVNASNLSQLELVLGNVGASVQAAEQAEFADASRDEFLRTEHRTTLADALHQAGRREEALARFREAETMQEKQQSQFPFLYSLRGFCYCDLLLAGAERAAARGEDALDARDGCSEVERRALQMLEWCHTDYRLLDIALDHLTLGRARLLKSILEGGYLNEAQNQIEQAVDGLRGAGQVQFLPRGLLTRAWLRSAQGDSSGAQADLDEAEQIAERGPMPLHLADIHLYRARLFHNRAALAEAQRLVEKHGYGRRREELADLEAMAAGW